jgi:hypothetical protein
MRKFLSDVRKRGTGTIAFGDLLLNDVRAYRETRMRLTQSSLCSALEYATKVLTLKLIRQLLEGIDWHDSEAPGDQIHPEEDRNLFPIAYEVPCPDRRQYNHVLKSRSQQNLLFFSCEFTSLPSSNQG